MKRPRQRIRITEAVTLFSDQISKPNGSLSPDFALEPRAHHNRQYALTGTATNQFNVLRLQDLNSLTHLVADDSALGIGYAD